MKSAVGEFMSNLKEVLKRSPVFGCLDDNARDTMIPWFDQRTLCTADVLSSRGDPAQYFFLLEKGTLMLELDQGKAIVLDKCGDFAGMELMAAHGIYKATATALAPGRVYTVSRQHFYEFIQGVTPAAAAVMAAWQTVLEQTAGFARNS